MAVSPDGEWLAFVVNQGGVGIAATCGGSSTATSAEILLEDGSGE